MENPPASKQEYMLSDSTQLSPSGVQITGAMTSGTRGLVSIHKSKHTKPNPRRQKPRILFMGQRRSGKSSICQVVFHKMPPHETLFLESTTSIKQDSINSLISFDIWDFPGQLDHFDPAFDHVKIFGEVGTLIWVLDAQDDIVGPLTRFQKAIIEIKKLYPDINIEVFIHKVDGISEEYVLETKGEIIQRTEDELADKNMSGMHIRYHLTSIYDYSIFEALSKVVQSLTPQLETIENMLDLLYTTTGIQKAFLFDAVSKLYVAADSSPGDIESFGICSDYIDLVADISDIYGGNCSSPLESEVSSDGSDISSMTTLQPGMLLYLKVINTYLVLVCVMRGEGTGKSALVDFNIRVFQDALLKVIHGEEGMI